MGNYNFPEDIIDEISKTNSKVSRLERAPQLANSSVAGANGVNLPVNALAYGEKATTNFNLYSCPGNNVWRIDPLDVGLTVIVTTGRLLITLSAMAWQSLGSSNSVMSYYMTGPTTNIVEDAFRGIVVPALAGAQAYSGGSFSFLHEGLENGTWFVKPKYMCAQYGATADISFFQNRTLIAKPY